MLFLVHLELCSINLCFWCFPLGISTRIEPRQKFCGMFMDMPKRCERIQFCGRTSSIGDKLSSYVWKNAKWQKYMWFRKKYSCLIRNLDVNICFLKMWTEIFASMFITFFLIILSINTRITPVKNFRIACYCFMYILCFTSKLPNCRIIQLKLTFF